MKLQNPDWAKKSPDALTDSARWSLYSSATGAAKEGRHQQDILEDFKWRFSDGKCKRSSCARDAETDLYRMIMNAAENAPLCIARFAEACSDVREQGHYAPTVREINSMLSRAYAGYQIEGDTVVRKSWTPEDAEVEGVPKPADASAEAADSQPAKPAIARHSATDAPRPPSRKRKLQIFLCHSSGDKPAVKELYDDLKADGYSPWLDTENLFPGQDWEAEIKKAVRNSHVVVVCLSHDAVTKAGFVQKEIKFALDVADEQPEGRIFMIPARLEDCKVPDRLSRWHWVNLFDNNGYNNLLASLITRASEL